MLIPPNSFSWIVSGEVTSGVVALVVTVVVARISLMSRFWAAKFEYQRKQDVNWHQGQIKRNQKETFIKHVLPVIAFQLHPSWEQQLLYNGPNSESM